jgi:hypothetical protein
MCLACLPRWMNLKWSQIFRFHLQNQHQLPGLRQVHRPVGGAMHLACFRSRYGNRFPPVPAPVTQSSPNYKGPVKHSVPGLLSLVL